MRLSSLAPVEAVVTAVTREANMASQLGCRRYEHGSRIWTSSKSSSEVAQVFGDDALTAARASTGRSATPR